MFEAHVLHLLRRYLGEYVHGLSAEALRISVWKGDVVLKDLKLKSEALNSLKLPLTVKAGFVGTITLKVPWKSLGKEPVIVLIDRVFILAHPASDGRTLKEEDRIKLFEAKLQQIEEAESATLDAISRSKSGSSSPGNSWLGSLIATIIGNLKISISNVHIRYEDSISNPGNPFCSGVTLAKLAAVTMDEGGNETFDTSGALDKLRKSLQLERLAVYHDSNSLPWKIEKRWGDLTPKEWIEIFEEGIREPSDDHAMLSQWAINRCYVVSPINGILKYHRLGNQERSDPEVPFEKASLFLSDISLTVMEAQYHDWIKLLEVVSRYKTYLEVCHLRPMVSVTEGPSQWWRYAAQACLQLQKVCYRFSWDHVRHLCQLRRRYIHLYACSLQQSSYDYSEIREIEKHLDAKVILLWRFLAHAKVESVKSKEAAEQRRLKKKSWFSLRWREESEEASNVDSSEELPLSEERLTKEEWQAINNLLSYQPDAELPSNSEKDARNMLQYLVMVSIGQASARIISLNQTEIVCGRFEQLDVSIKFKGHSIRYDLSLRFYGVSGPEGSLAQSVSSENKVNALAASFVRSPVGENIDWRLSATISPSYVTVLMESFDRFFDFVRRSNAVSPTIALETANALQVRIGKVTRRAQEQFQTVLEEQSRFALDIDLDAPKVKVPVRMRGSLKCDSHFLLDFGHFTLHTVENQSDEHEKSLYSRFYIAGRDIAAFFADCGSDSNSSMMDAPNQNCQTLISDIESTKRVYSLIDRCGMAVIFDQIKVPHSSYPSMRVSVQVPNLGIHFSPIRYLKLMELLNILYNTMENCGQPTADNSQTERGPWGSSDLATSARILVWKGIGNSMATWHPCFLVLCGSYLYVLESERSESYQRYLSMAGRQVFEIHPTSVGGSTSCIAISFRGMEIQKALESSTTWIVQLHDEDEKAAWLKGLIIATYQASAPPSVNILGEKDDGVTMHDEPQTRKVKAADLVVHGALHEMSLCIYGKTGDKSDEVNEETLILEVLASGGKVHVIRWESDLSVKMKLHSLKIKDELQGHISGGLQYLACSVLKNEKTPTPRGASVSHCKVTSPISQEEDDTFKDALPDFMSLMDPGIYSPKMDLGFMGGFTEYADIDTVESFNLENDPVEGMGIPNEIYYEAQGSDSSNFVTVVFSTRSSGSLEYDGIDTQMSIRMSKLEFFCNRPTLVALIGFGLDISSVNYVDSGTDTTTNNSLINKEKTEDSGRVKGLLGFGKNRVVFNLKMNVDSVAIFLSKEDGSQLAMFVQESFLLDIKVHPSSLSIEGTLGNLRLCDMSNGKDHFWSWLCDIRNPGVDSLIKFKFDSYSAEDDDYEGYDYSLTGRLSAVRIVFLYRFVQEVTAYFMDLATPHTEEAIKLVDKVGDFEWLIQKYEIDGATALKLDLSLDTPIIIVPMNSMSKDFIQLDLGQLRVTNEFSWHGCPDKDPSAVHVDVLHAQILGINMFVGVDGIVGKPMVRDGQGFDVYVRRSLRDVFRKVPTLALEVKLGFLHGVMSNKEYDVILNCIYMNLSEEPALPPSFRGSKSGTKNTIRLLVDKVNINGQNLLSRTVTIIAVEVNYALLELCNSSHEELPLAHIALEGLWVSYRMTSLSETDLYVTVPRFSILDSRPDTKHEMRLMLGSSTDASRQISGGSKANSTQINLEAGHDFDISTPTMLLMDYRWRVSSTSCVLRVQQPRVLVVPDFLLAVGEFFVPALRAITGREESMDPKNDPVSRHNFIVLSDSMYKQTEDAVHLSPSRKLVADCVGIDEYIYDGCGKLLCLSEESNGKEAYFARSPPIIVIGRGKRLRFRNVKIKNGFLLKKYVHLSSESSYSVSAEDDVDLLLVDNISSNPENKIQDYMHGSPETSDALDHQSDSNGMQSFTFEAQVVSPEFTFYDSTKSSLDNFSDGEKLLRAKMDLSFMFASKGNDTWIRTLVKDLTIEAGSGLIIIDPVDISGGYTSVKEKINISLISTNIYIHLSLSAVSLLLNLLNEAAVALRFGSAIPLAPCLNYDRIWVSSKENGPGNNLTFWRPHAPPNYVIMGDCVTSRPIPPSQTVMAVNNTYGRVRKPIGFNLIGLSSDIQGLKGGHDHSGTDCSIWMPIAPPGYTALGCVANAGSQPPPNHIVYCLRSDLVTSTTYLECLSSVPSSPLATSGFSIWRLDNVIGSFYAHSSTGSPIIGTASDISHLLLWNSIRFSKGYGSELTNHCDGSQQMGNQTPGSSGWDILRSVSKTTSHMSTPNFERIWWDKGGDLRRPVSIWRPVTRPGYAVLGDCLVEGLEPPALGIIYKANDPDISAKPVQFTKVAQITGKACDEVFFWFPIAPPGYASLGCVVSRRDEAPRLDLVSCPRMDLVFQANIHDVPISRSSNSKTSQCWSIWKIENPACTFLARSDFKKPSSRLALTIGDSTKPKTRENITAEMKLRCFSVTVLDNSCGMMTPLFDTTITNIKLATHGRIEAMNAVLISSIAASTFNTQLEAWEPLIEPFDGIFKFETYETSAPQPSRLGKRVSIAATSILNINVSAASLETSVQTMLSWKRQLEIEQKAAKLLEGGSYHGREEDPTFSALDKDDFQTVIVENKLGCDMYLKRLEEDSETVSLLHKGDTSSLWIPPPRFADRLNIADESRESRCYVVIQIVEAKVSPIIDDGNGHNFFCALRLIVDTRGLDQQKLFPQSARTKCVRPSVTEVGNCNEGTAKWNELFIFDVPRKGLAKLEVEVTNLAAKAGKGEVVGALSFSVGRGSQVLKKIASARVLHQPADTQNTVSYPLKRKHDSVDAGRDCGCLLVSTSYFERNTIANVQGDNVSENVQDSDIGFWIGLGQEGKWESIRSLLPLYVVPKLLENDYVAMEVFMKNGKKHAIFRGLVKVVNDSDVKLDISTSDVRFVQGPNHTSSDFTGMLPGSSDIIPWRCACKESDQCLLVRPFVDPPGSLYHWGRGVSVGFGDVFVRDQPLTDQGSLTRQTTSKYSNKVPDFIFKLNQLEKKDVVLCCVPSAGNKQFWLSVGSDASVLHTELNSPVYDWTISLNSPLKLENRLPCQAEFTIWEKTKEGKCIERQHGVISSRKSVHVYSVDICRPIYLTLFCQGGWVLEKDPVLILDLSSNNCSSSFWMVHHQSRRRLRMIIERDMGGTSAAPKIIRFFVPYWIINDSYLPLAYRVVEIEPSESTDMDSISLSRAAKSAKTAFKNPTFSMERRQSMSRRNLQVLEVIEDISPMPSMLSPQESAGRSGVVLFPSQKTAYPSPRVGIAVASRHSEIFSPGISLLDLEKKERVDVKAYSSDGSYYKLSALLNMTSDRTKVVHFQPHALLMNRVGCSICIQQCDSQLMDWIHPTEPPKNFQWQSSVKVELIKVRVDGYNWSAPFSVCNEGVIRITLKKENSSDELKLRVEVRSGTKNSRYEVVFRPNSLSSPYRIENRSMFLPIRFRQLDGDAWCLLLPNSAASFLWDDLSRQRLVELFVEGTDPLKSEKYNIDEICDHQPVNVAGGPIKALRVTVLKEDKTNIVKISDWMPENESTAVTTLRVQSSSSQLSRNGSEQQSLSATDSELHVVVELPELGISVVDHTPEEILYISVQNLLLAYSTGLGSGFSRYKLRMHGLQVDNQLPLTSMPVLFRPHRVGDQDNILKFSVTVQSDGSLDLRVYPYIGLSGPDNSAFLINIYEPIIWRLHEMVQQVNLDRIYDSQTTAVSVDPIIQIGVLSISEVKFKVTMAMSPSQRPRGVLGFWSSLMTALGNTENMPVRINQRFHENVCMRQSTMINNAVSNIKKDLLGQPLQLLSGVDILGNASSALGHMSKGVAALSMDKKFIQSRQRQENKGVEDLGDVIREGGGALAKGLFRGVTGILTKPLEGAKSSGVEGFVQGFGKGLIGAAAQPVSGVLDLLSKTTEGANAMRMKIASAIASDEQLLRRRLPRVISGDNLLRPYEEYKAQGQVILQLAESVSFFSQVDLFKVRGKFALSDSYEDHFMLPKGSILLVTHRRIILLQQPNNIIGQRKFSPARDPCSVSWDVLWNDLATMELTRGKNDNPKSPPSRLILYLRSRPSEMKEQVRIVKCDPESHQAIEVYSSIDRALNIYGPNQPKESPKKKASKPYSPITDGVVDEVTSKEEICTWPTQQVPAPVLQSSTFGSSST